MFAFFLIGEGEPEDTPAAECNDDDDVIDDDDNVGDEA